MARAYAPGREQRMAAAQAKRDRKAEKRARDATASAIGQMHAREVLDRGFYITAGGVFPAKVTPVAIDRLYVDIVLPEAGAPA
jgi:hypothetical protein